MSHILILHEYESSWMSPAMRYADFVLPSDSSPTEILDPTSSHRKHAYSGIMGEHVMQMRLDDTVDVALGLEKHN
jgi:hypothetical protein